MAEPREHYNGTYLGRLTKVDYADFSFIELQDDGTEYPPNYIEEHHYDFRGHPEAIMRFTSGDFQVGDRVKVYVEFERYTAVHVEHYDLDPRRLHNRLLRIEQRLGLETP